jgi:hypothetical protein
MAFNAFEEHQKVTLLNNTGVSLMERHCYGDAINTMNDALAISRELVQEKPLSVTNSMYQSYLHKAAQRLARSATRDRLMAGQHLNVVLLTSDKNQDHLWYDNMWPISGAVIRMDDCNDDGSNLKLNSAIILNNYGMACRCQSLVVDNKTRASALLGGAIKFVVFAYRVLEKEFDDDLCDIEAKRTMLVCMIVLQNLALIKLEMGKLGEGAQEYYDLLNSLESDYSMVGTSTPDERSLNAAPAA